MIVRTIIPWLTGGALVSLVAVAVAHARRPGRTTMASRSSTARFAPDPVGPDDGMVEVLELAARPNPKARTEGEAIAAACAGWPLFDEAPVGDASFPSLGADVPHFGSNPRSRPTQPSTSAGSSSMGFAEVEPGEAFLDLDIDFEDLETPSDSGSAREARERLELDDALARDDVRREWLERVAERVDTIENTEEREPSVSPRAASGDSDGKELASPESGGRRSRPV